MGRFDLIVNESLADKKAFPDSIPHLLHWDLMFLAILEYQGPLRPKAWKGRIDAWKFLVRCLLTGRLRVEWETLTHPVDDLSRKFGVEAVGWVFIGDRPEPVGVLSPTVLVRPLPDFSDGDLARWGPDAKGRFPEEDTFKAFLRLAMARLQEHQSREPDSFATSRLIDILGREFGAVPPGPPANPGIEQPVPILDRVSFVHRGEIDATRSGTVSVLVAESGPHVPKFVPRCEQCREILTQKAQDNPFDASAGVVRLVCSKRHQTEIPLADLAVWLRDKSAAVLWRTESTRFVATPPARGYPPPPTIEGSVLTFEWGPAYVGGELERRFLKVSLPERAIKSVDPATVFFELLLFPGTGVDVDPPFGPVPVRLEWLDAVESPEKITFEAAAEFVKFRNLRLKGYFRESDGRSSLAFSKEFRGPLLDTRRQMGVGIYPDPGSVPSSWRWYRVFVNGASPGEFEIHGDPPLRELTPDLGEGESVRAVSIIRREARDAGITFLARTGAAENDRATEMLNLGLDFGTTNTLIYHSKPSAKYSEANALRHRFRPGDAAGLCLWVRRGHGTDEQVTIGGFLPGPRYGSPRDPYLVPSAIVAGRAATLIRWSGGQLGAARWGFEPKGDFKWDHILPGENREARKAFLAELLFIALPVILRANRLEAVTSVRIGYAFPLAFGQDAVADLNELEKTLTEHFRTRAGVHLNFHFISESHAAVRAFVWPNPSDTFLIADMGGGTMDVAVVRGHGTGGVLQVGSVRFAGNHFLGAFLAKKGAASDSPLAWELRDLIVEGKASAKYGGDAAAGGKLRAHATMALEFLRTMIAALRLKDGGETQVTVVLVGNAWHFVEEFGTTNPSIGKAELFRIFVKGMIEKLGIASIAQKTARELQRDLPSSKHLVVLGALQNAEDPTFTLADQPGSKLPAGRGLNVKWSHRGQEQKIAWSDMVGTGGDAKFLAELDPRTTETNFLFDDAPPASSSWAAHLQDVFGAPKPSYPEEGQIRRDFYGSLVPGIERPLKGPLQLVLEGHWSDWLGR